MAPNSSAVPVIDVNGDTTMAEGQRMTVADVVAQMMDGGLRISCGRRSRWSPAS